jgi:hypothetical protein
LVARAGLLLILAGDGRRTFRSAGVFVQAMVQRCRLDSIDGRRLVIGFGEAAGLDGYQVAAEFGLVDGGLGRRIIGFRLGWCLSLRRRYVGRDVGLIR